jgi:hypothetical protein
MPPETPRKPAALAALDKPKFAILNDEQNALLSRLTTEGFYQLGEDGMKVTVTDPTAKAFCDALRVADVERAVTVKALEAIEGKFRGLTKQLNYKVVDAKLGGGVASDFGYFCCDAGIGPMEASYSSLPRYYDKIEKGLKEREDLLREFAEVRQLADQVVALDKARIRTDYMRSLNAIEDLFLSTRAEFMNEKGFFNRPSEFVSSPIDVNTKAELGARAVECLTKCADNIEQYTPDAKGGAELVKAAREFAKAIESKGFEKDFAALNTAFKALPPSLPPR